MDQWRQSSGHYCWSIMCQHVQQSFGCCIDVGPWNAILSYCRHVQGYLRVVAVAHNGPCWTDNGRERLVYRFFVHTLKSMASVVIGVWVNNGPGLRHAVVECNYGTNLILDDYPGRFVTHKHWPIMDQCKPLPGHHRLARTAVFWPLYTLVHDAPSLVTASMYRIICKLWQWHTISHAGLVTAEEGLFIDLLYTCQRTWQVYGSVVVVIRVYNGARTASTRRWMQQLQNWFSMTILTHSWPKNTGPKTLIHYRPVRA